MRDPEAGNSLPDADRDRFERGMAVRRAVLGDDHVDRAIASTTKLDAAFQHYITGAAWADVWGREGLDRPTKSLLTVALLAALGQDHELAMHYRGARRTGASPDQIVEALMHVAIYAGLPAANRAFAILKEVEGGRDDASTDTREA